MPVAHHYKWISRGWDTNIKLHDDMSVEWDDSGETQGGWDFHYDAGKGIGVYIIYFSCHGPLHTPKMHILNQIGRDCEVYRQPYSKTSFEVLMVPREVGHDTNNRMPKA